MIKVEEEVEVEVEEVEVEVEAASAILTAGCCPAAAPVLWKP